MASVDVDIDDELIVRGQATAREEGMTWPQYLNRALRLQIEHDNLRRAERDMGPPQDIELPPQRRDPGE